MSCVSCYQPGKSEFQDLSSFSGFIHSQTKHWETYDFVAIWNIVYVFNCKCIFYVTFCLKMSEYSGVLLQLSYSFQCLLLSSYIPSLSWGVHCLYSVFIVCILCPLSVFCVHCLYSVSIVCILCPLSVFRVHCLYSVSIVCIPCLLSVFCVHCLYSVSMSGNYYLLLSEYIVYYLMSLSALGVCICVFSLLLCLYLCLGLLSVYYLVFSICVQGILCPIWFDIKH